MKKTAAPTVMRGVKTPFGNAVSKGAKTSKPSGRSNTRGGRYGR